MNIFRDARIRLTAWYLLIIMAVSGMFSMFIYRVMVSELDRFEVRQRMRLERRLRDQALFPFAPDDEGSVIMIDPELIEDTRKRILYRLLIVNGGILIVAGGLGYLLAGRTLNPIAEMVEEQHRFVSDASHELKTPLTSIKTAMEVFLRDKRHTLADASDLIKDSIKDIDKLAQLSESLLRLAHQEGQPSLSLLRDIQLDDVIGDALKRTMPLAKKKQIGVVVGDMKATVSGTRDSLTEVFVILLDNAVKYSPKGSEVSVSGIRRNGMYQISVRDQGMGISVIDQKHIFDRFYRADNARTGGESGGYGLGLSIARKIITEHKGTITVSSREGEGSEFIVTLPVRRRNTS